MGKREGGREREREREAAADIHTVIEGDREGETFILPKHVCRVHVQDMMQLQNIVYF